MKNLIVGSLIALAASQAAGCIITSGDDTEDAFITANWKITHLAPEMNISCPPGFDTAALYNQPVDSNFNPFGSAIVDLFDCEAHSGTSAPLAPGIYQSWIEIANHDNTSVYAQSLSAIVDVIDQDKTFSAQILENGGYFQLQWNLVGAQSNQSLSCAAAGAAGGVDVTGTVVSSTEANSDVFDCEDFFGITAGYRAATYTVSVSALDGSESPLGIAPAMTKTIGERNAVTNLGTINIPIDGL